MQLFEDFSLFISGFWNLGSMIQAMTQNKWVQHQIILENFIIHQNYKDTNSFSFDISYYLRKYF